MTETLVSQQRYAAVVREALDQSVTKRCPGRLIWLFVHLGIIAAAILAISNWHNAAIDAFAGIAIGHSLGIMGFLGHEIMHGSVVRGKRRIALFGGICMAHWGILPSVWIRWHNQQHHQHTQHSFEDPDCFGWENLYRRSRWLQTVERLTPGSESPLSALFLFSWFTLHTGWIVWGLKGFFPTRRERYAARLYFVAVPLVALSTTYVFLGPLACLWVVVLPLVISNVMMMSYVATNHLVSPLTEDVNDPLLNSLTVRSPRWLEWLHLHNNFHVEHHVVPNVNPRHARRVAEVLAQQWPDRYQALNHLVALRHVYRSPRFYSDHAELMNPRTGRRVRTLNHHFFEI